MGEKVNIGGATGPGLPSPAGISEITPLVTNPSPVGKLLGMSEKVPGAVPLVGVKDTCLSEVPNWVEVGNIEFDWVFWPSSKVPNPDKRAVNM